jgi:hypothetical protein
VTLNVPPVQRATVLQKRRSLDPYSHSSPPTAQESPVFGTDDGQLEESAASSEVRASLEAAASAPASARPPASDVDPSADPEPRSVVDPPHDTTSVMTTGVAATNIMTKDRALILK